MPIEHLYLLGKYGHGIFVFATETMELIILENDRVMDDGLARRNDFRSSD